MKQYRVEAFIIPSHAKLAVESNQIDDVKLANKLKDQSFNSDEEMEVQCETNELHKSASSENLSDKLEAAGHSSSEFSEIFFETNEHIYDEIIIPENRDKKSINNEKAPTEYTKAFFKIEEPIYDEPFVGTFCNVSSKCNNIEYNVPQSRWTLATSKYRRFGIVAPKLPKRSSSLKSITEDIENFDETLQEMCGQRNKISCMPSIQKPEDISEEIFKENWMQRLDALRKLETLLKDKEIALQSRERLLFKKEKELRILERLVKDKMKQAELYAKRYKKSQSVESITNKEQNLESRSSSNGSKDQVKSEGLTNLTNLPLKANSKLFQTNKDEQILTKSSNTRIPFTTNRLCNRIGSVRSRSKPRQKIRYDDLDTTLSADNGDASFVVTSRMFDPETFKKPVAFTRSASERRSRIDQQTVCRLINLTEKGKCIDNYLDNMDEKTIKKISENILASHDQETKFLNYGLIDKRGSIEKRNINKNNLVNKKRCTNNLNLDGLDQTNKIKISKERPTSWSEDTDDWLKKKRQAYNLATKNQTVQNVYEKENFNTLPKMNKPEKLIIKKENRKKFSLFR